MDDSKIFMFPDGGTSKTSNDVNSLLPLLMCNGGFGPLANMVNNNDGRDLLMQAINGNGAATQRLDV